MIRYILLPVAVIVVALLFSCGKDDLITDSDAKLEFSTDTLRFDTVFTELGSATRLVKLFNPHDNPIRIDQISVKAGDQSFFRLNIDGTSGNSATDIEIRAKDSLYIFAEVTIDPDQPLSNSPFIINDEILLETNGNSQVIVLEAWGQNANYIPNRFNNGGTALLTCDFGSVTWDDPKRDGI